MQKLLFILLMFLNSSGFCQFGADEKPFLTMSKVTIAIGTIINDTVLENNKKIGVEKFVTVGSGLITYAKYDTLIFNSIITAGHVINFFKENKLKNIFLRPSWADTIKTTEYYGIEIPIINVNNTPNTFLYPDKKVDLGCIIILPIYYNKLFLEKTSQAGNTVFPYNNMTTPYLGDQVWISGYPRHIQSEMQNRFLYSISTFKPGYIAWRPSSTTNNEDLAHITLVESNATYGNSGGPVFSIHEKLELVGILVSGYEEANPIYLNNKPLIDTVTKQPFIAKARSGVSIIEKAEYVKKFIEFVQIEMKKYR